MESLQIFLFVHYLRYITNILYKCTNSTYFQPSENETPLLVLTHFVPQIQEQDSEQEHLAEQYFLISFF